MKAADGIKIAEDLRDMYAAALMRREMPLGDGSSNEDFMLNVHARSSCNLIERTSAAEERERVLRDAANEFRDAALNQRGQFEEPCLDNDQTNAVLGAFDDTIGAALATPAPQKKEGSSESVADVRVVRPVDRSILGQRQEDLIPLPITDDRLASEDRALDGFRALADLIIPAPQQPAKKRYRLNSGPCAAQIVDCDCHFCSPELEDRPAEKGPVSE